MRVPHPRGVSVFAARVGGTKSSSQRAEVLRSVGRDRDGPSLCRFDSAGASGASKALRVQWLQFAAIDFHGKALHDGIQREHYAEAVLLAHHYPLHSGKCAGANARPLPYLQ